ncbi:MAG: CapA family protein [Lachnospiraceae bacterium]|nr:CapA family protein [Lachnospiraceae bacterium]
MSSSERNKKKKWSRVKMILTVDACLAIVLAGVIGYSQASSYLRTQAKENAAIQVAEAAAAQEAAEKAEAAESARQAIEDGEAAAIAAEREEAERIAAEQAEAKRLEEELAEAAEPAEAEVTVHLTMAGDVLLSSLLVTNSETDYGYDFTHLFENTAPYLAEYDLKIVNEETACGGGEYGITGYPSFNSPHEAQDAIAAAGFNVVCLATNHMLDLGTGPLYSTIEYWNNMYPSMALIGAYGSQEASDQIYYYEKDGFRIAILNYTYGSNAGSGEYYDAPFCLNMLYEDEVRADIQNAKANSDYVIVCPHWGTEFNFSYDEEQSKWAQIFLQEGVDLVLGTHPHVIEPIELFTREDGHQMICYYSLGNFVSNQDPAYALVGGLADVSLRKTADGVVVDDYGIIPIVTHKSWYYSAYLLKDYTQELADSSIGPLVDPEFSYQYCVDLAVSMYGDRLRMFR